MAGADGYWDFELECEAPAGAEGELALGLRGATYLRTEGRLSIVFLRKAETLEAAVGRAVMEVLGAGVGVKVLAVDVKPERMI